MRDTSRLNLPLHSLVRLLPSGLLVVACLASCASEGAASVAPDAATDTAGAESDTGPGGADGSDVADHTDGTDGTEGAKLAIDVGPTGVVFTWEDTGKPHERLIVEQSGMTFGHAAVMGTHYVIVPVGGGYQVGTATWRLEASEVIEFTDVEVVSEGSFEVIEHLSPVIIGAVAPSDHKLEGLPNVAQKGDEVTLSGHSGTKGLRAILYVGRPDGWVDPVLIGDQKDLPANQSFAGKLTFVSDGLYVIELLDSSSLPVLIEPVYVGNVAPLAPALLDTFPQEKLAEPLPLADLREAMRAKVNELRGKFGLGALPTHPLLDQTAQTKAEDMRDQAYFAHQSPDGKKAGDLAADAGLGGFISENIAMQYDVERIFALWYWSPSHRQSYLDAKWKSIGHGIAMSWDDTGRVLFAQHLSSEEP